MSKFCKCGEPVHPVRQKYGYKTCMPCSGIERVASAPITNHKTGNTIQIVSQAVADAVAKGQVDVKATAPVSDNIRVWQQDNRPQACA